VTVSDSDSTYIFLDKGDGRYEWRRVANFVRYGRWCRLEILLTGGQFIYSEIITPKIWFEEGADTIWIDPDSITAWSAENAVSVPTAVEGPHVSHTITYRGTPGACIDLHASSGWRKWPSSHSPYSVVGLYRRIEKTDSTIIIYTAVESPLLFRHQFVIVSNLERHWEVYHRLHRELELMNRDDDPWPVENLEEVSNVEGAYGIFTGAHHYPDNSYVIALKP
jgi:hypothetical protein